MELMSPIDSLFLAAESREHPLHVGALQLYTPPAGVRRGFVRDTHQALLQRDEIAPLFRKRPMGIHGAFSNLAWTSDNDIDLDYHVRRSALPSPGRVRELLELTSRLHTNLLDRHRPLWEMHLIEGLKDGRFAIYTKIHHALVDGVAGMTLMQESMNTDASDAEFNAPWAPMAPEPPKPPRPSLNPVDRPRRNLVQNLGGTLGSVASLAPSTLRLARAAFLEQQLTLPFGAPRTMLNVPVGERGAVRRSPGRWTGSTRSKPPRG